MMKKAVLVVSGLLALALLCGCAENAPVQNTAASLSGSASLDAAPSDDSPPAASDDAAAQPPAAERDPQLSMVAAASGLLFYQYAGTEDGCYETMTNMDFTANILYTDYASQCKIYLSAQPQSTHRSEDDTSFILSMTGGVSIFCTPNKLYVAKLGEPSLVQALGEDGRAGFLQMNLDGSDRKAIWLADKEAFCLSSGIARDDGHLYYLRYRYTGGDDMSADSEVCVQLIALDERTCEQQVLVQLDDSTAYRILGVWSRGLVFSKADRSGSRQLLLYDMQENRLTESPAQDCGGYRMQMVGDTIYYWVPEEEALYACNAETGAQECLGQGLLADVPAHDSSDLVGECHDGRLFLSCTDTEIGESWKFAFDLATRQLTPLTLRDEEGKFVGIYAENSEYFFVKTGNLSIPVQDTAPDGTPFLGEQIVLVNSLIKKEDYWNNRPNFIPIESEIYGT